MKTAILAKNLTARLGVRTLFVANKKSLLDDAKSDFERGIAGIAPNDIGVIMDGRFGHYKMTSESSQSDIPGLDMPVIVATIQSLHAKLNDPRTRSKLLEWLKSCEFVMIDETQAVGTRIWSEVLSFIYAPYRVALSATPRRTDGATLEIYAWAGKLSFETTADTQIEKGRLSEVRIKSVVYDHRLYNEDAEGLVYAECYNEWVVGNHERNTLVLDSADMMVKEGRHVLILIQYIEHGDVLIQMLIDEYGYTPDDIRFIYGETSDKARTRAIQEFRRGEFKILVGSTIFDAGVNIPIISGVVLAGAGNSEITLIQRIGRGVRNADYEAILGYIPEFMKQTDNKKVTSVVDIYDVNVKFFERQAKNRFFTAKGEFGKERIKRIGTIFRPDKEKGRKTSADQMSKNLSELRVELTREETDELLDKHLFNLSFGDIMKQFEDFSGE